MSLPVLVTTDIEVRGDGARSGRVEKTVARISGWS